MKVLTLVSFLLAVALIIVSNTDLPIAQEIGLTKLSPSVADPSQIPRPDTPLDSKRFTLSFALLISSLAVFVFYFMRFASWPSEGDERLKIRPTRFYTTSVRYGIFATLYAGGMVLFFFFANQFPEYFSAVVATLGAGGSLQSSQVQAAELLAYTLAFFLVVWPNLPVVDDSIRRILQENAGIPFEADSLVSSLLTSSNVKFSPDSESVEQVLSWDNVAPVLKTEDFDVQVPGERLEYILARTGYLIARLQTVEGEKRYSRTLKSQEVECQNIVSGFDSILDIVVSASGEMGSLISKKLVKDAKSFLRKAYDLVVCSVLTVEGSPAARRNGFHKFGFTFNVRDPLTVDLNIVIKLLALAFLSVCLPTIFIFIFLFTEGSPQPHVGQYIPKNYVEAIWWSAFGAAMHIAAAVVAVFVIRSVVIEERQAAQASAGARVSDSDVESNIVNYATAALLGFSVNVILLALLDIVEPKSIVRNSWMWAIIPGVTSWFVAYNMSHLVKNQENLKINMQSLIHGTGTCVFAMIVAFLAVLGDNHLYPTSTGLFFTLFAGISAFLVGFTVSKTVLEWYTKRWSSSGDIIKEIGSI